MAAPIASAACSTRFFALILVSRSSAPEMLLAAFIISFLLAFFLPAKSDLIWTGVLKTMARFFSSTMLGSIPQNWAVMRSEFGNLVQEGVSAATKAGLNSSILLLMVE